MKTKMSVLERIICSVLLAGSLFGCASFEARHPRDRYLISDYQNLLLPKSKDVFQEKTETNLSNYISNPEKSKTNEPHLLPQMQNWNTQDKILGGIFIGECVWDGYESSKLTKAKGWKEVGIGSDNNTKALAIGITGMYLGLKLADVAPIIRTPLLIGLDILEWGGASISIVKW